MKKILIIMFSLIFLLAISLPAFCQNDEEYSSDESEEGLAPKNFSVGLQAGYKYTIGDWGKVWGNGWGFFALLDYRVTKEIGIGLKTGYMYWNANSETTDMDNQWDNFPVNLQAIYYFDRTKSFQAYGALEFGANMMTYTRKEYYDDPKTHIRTTVTSHQYYTKPGIAPVLGCLMPLGAFNMNFSVKYNMILGGDIKNINYLGLNAGLSYGLW
jgi:hypothetical protein